MEDLKSYMAKFEEDCKIKPKSKCIVEGNN